MSVQTHIRARVCPRGEQVCRVYVCALWSLCLCSQGCAGWECPGVCLSQSCQPGSSDRACRIPPDTLSPKPGPPPGPGPMNAAPPLAREARSGRHPRCSDPYPLRLLPDSGLHPGENLDRLLHHLLLWPWTDPGPLRPRLSKLLIPTASSEPQR